MTIYSKVKILSQLKKLNLLAFVACVFASAIQYFLFGSVETALFVGIISFAILHFLIGAKENRLHRATIL